MKKSIVIIVAVLMLILSGCDSSESNNKAPELSEKISSMEVLIDNNIIKISDKLKYTDLEKMGFTLDTNYNGVLEETLNPSDSENKSFNIVTSDKKLIALSVMNSGKMPCKVKDCIITFIGSYPGEEYDHSYTLPGNIKYNASADSMKKVWGNPQLDLSMLEEGKMIQYSSDKCTFTANLDNSGNMTAFSINLTN